MKVLVSGCSGFIGSHIVDKLLADGNNVVGLDLWFNDVNLRGWLKNPNFEFKKGSVLDEALTKKLFQDVEIVIHLAAILGTSETIEKYDPLDVANVNIIGTLKMLKNALNNDVKRIIVPSTPDVEWLNPYKITKAAMEKFCLLYHKYYGLNTVVLKLFNVYGPRERWLTSGFKAPYNYQKVIPTFIVNALLNKPLPIYGDGDQQSDYIFVEDVAEAFIRATGRKEAIGRIIPIGSGNLSSVNRLADLITQLTKSKSKKTYLPMRKGEIPLNITADTSVAEKLLGFKAKNSLKEGLIKTIPYYKEQI